jgi:hypothetical protein
MDRAPDNGGIPLECSAALPHPRSGLHLWHHRYAPLARYGHSGQADRTSIALAEQFCRKVDRIDFGANASTTLSSRARRICAGSCKLIPAITTRSERTGHWTRMRRSPVQSSRLETSNHTLFLVDFITITSGPRFAVHTGQRAGRPSIWSCRDHSIGKSVRRATPDRAAAGHRLRSRRDRGEQSQRDCHVDLFARCSSPALLCCPHLVPATASQWVDNARSRRVVYPTLCARPGDRSD